jgi:hypothetical protein
MCSPTGALLASPSKEISRRERAADADPGPERGPLKPWFRRGVIDQGTDEDLKRNTDDHARNHDDDDEPPCLGPGQGTILVGQGSRPWCFAD